LLGNLSEKEALQLNCNDLFMCHKQIEGFNLLKFMKDELTKEQFNGFKTMIRDDFDQNTPYGKMFVCCGAGKDLREDLDLYGLEEIDKALLALEKGGRNVLIRCNEVNVAGKGYEEQEFSK
jgi:hypothetical protein